MSGERETGRASGLLRAFWLELAAAECRRRLAENPQGEAVRLEAERYHDQSASILAGLQGGARRAGARRLTDYDLSFYATTAEPLFAWTVGFADDAAASHAVGALLQAQARADTAPITTITIRRRGAPAEAATDAWTWDPAGSWRRAV
jgi:hypothetical protein